MSKTVKYELSEDRMPGHWYNLAADLPEPLAPPLHPGTLEPIGPEMLEPLFPMALIAQEVAPSGRSRSDHSAHGEGCRAW